MAASQRGALTCGLVISGGKGGDHHGNREFTLEDPDRGTVYTFARRRGCEDYAGFSIVDSCVTERVIYYDLTYSDVPNRYLISGRYHDLWAFLREVVILDTASWLSEEDIVELAHPDDEADG